MTARDALLAARRLCEAALGNAAPKIFWTNEIGVALAERKVSNDGGTAQGTYCPLPIIFDLRYIFGNFAAQFPLKFRDLTVIDGGFSAALPTQGQARTTKMTKTQNRYHLS